MLREKKSIEGEKIMIYKSLLEEVRTYGIQYTDGRIVTVMRKNTSFIGTGRRNGCDCRHFRETH